MLSSADDSDNGLVNKSVLMPTFASNGSKANGLGDNQASIQHFILNTTQTSQQLIYHTKMQATASTTQGIHKQAKSEECLHR